MELIQQFNETSTEVLDLLDYGNIERVWLERKRSDSREETTFELHIVRKQESGVYECKLQHLSESERAVVGLVIALTGYLVHDVNEHCPIMLLDSIEMIDSDRITALLEYLDTQTEYLVVALLPEDTAVVSRSADIDLETIAIGDESV